jgi:biopolymer transport protein ExbD
MAQHKNFMTVGRTEEEQEEINITPMLDVVFIMLIFFIVTATFVKEAGVEVDRPPATTAIPKPRANILVAIDSQSQIWIDRRTVDADSVRAAIERLLAENPEGSVVIQADKEAVAESLIAVMDAARDAGAQGIAVAAEES